MGQDSEHPCEQQSRAPFPSWWAGFKAQAHLPERLPQGTTSFKDNHCRVTTTQVLLLLLSFLKPPSAGRVAGTRMQFLDPRRCLHGAIPCWCFLVA